MAFGPSPASAHPMGHLRGYSDFFASGFRAVSTGVRRRPTSLYSTTTSTDTDYDSSASILPNVFRARYQPRQRRTSMMIFGSQSNSIGNSESRDRRFSLVAFSSRLLDRIPFCSGDENASTSSSAGKAKSKRFSKLLRNNNHINSEAQEVWVSAGGPFTPSAPNGGPDITESHSSIDPFASSPDSKSFLIDLSSSDGENNLLKRNSFLSMTTTSNSSASLSLFHLPRKERPISLQATSHPPRPSRSCSRRSSFQCRGQSREKSDFWILEEEADILTAEPIVEDHESRDDAAQIDWRQFHNDLLTVEV